MTTVLWRWLACGLGTTTLLLIAATGRLWTPQTVFPQIPFLEILCYAPGMVDVAALVAAMFGGACAVIAPKFPRVGRVGLSVLFGSLLILVLLDQHRLQPWTYELGLLILILSLSTGSRGWSCARAIVVSVYLWSGFSKIDPEFFHAHGQMLLDGLLQAIGLSSALWSQKLRWTAAVAMPVLEILVGLLLALPATRRWGIRLSIVLHLAILLAVGPLGLNHEPAVWLWNIWFPIQNAILFHSARRHDPTASTGATGSAIGDRMAVLVTGLAVGLPALNLIGWFDHWPSWSVYSSRPEQVRMFVHESRVGDLPAGLQSLVEPPILFEPWRRVNLDRWSFVELNCPPYPQERWRLAVAQAIAEKAGLGDRVQVEISRRTGWWIRSWNSVELHGTAALREACESYRLNTRSRWGE